MKSNILDADLSSICPEFNQTQAAENPKIIGKLFKLTARS
jgi:hypothetical protein